MNYAKRLGVVAVTLLVGGCTAPAPSDSRQGPVGEEIAGGGDANRRTTPRAVAAIVLQYLPPDPSFVGPAEVDRLTPKGSVGVEMRYSVPGADPFLQVLVIPIASAKDLVRFVDECPQSDSCLNLNGDVTLAWTTAEDEEGPGGYHVLRVGSDEVILVSVENVDALVGDPRDQALTPSAQTVIDMTSDPLLALKTTANAIDAGRSLEVWRGTSRSGSRPHASAFPRVHAVLGDGLIRASRPD